jgi:predicted dehydrogenase
VLGAPNRKGANERIFIGHIGFGGRAKGLYKELGPLRDRGEAESVAICDVDEKRLEEGSKLVGPKLDVYRDYRYILERKDIDAVVIGTPDHWHAVQFVHSAESGKHIYCEKPAHCTIEEGKAMVAAAKKAGIASQIGSQGRSQPEAYLMHRFLANGAIGKVSHVECFHYTSPEDNTQTADSDPPPELDWDLWLGPLRWRPYNKKYHHGVFRWLLESGGGQIRDRGAHVMSCAMWWMGADGTGPVTIEASGTPPKQGLWDSAVEMTVKYTFKNPDWVMTWNQMPNEEVLKRYPAEPRTGQEPGGKISRPGYGAVYHGDQGTCIHWGGDGGTWAERKVRQWTPPAGAKEVYKSPGHMEDWFLGIRTGQKTIMNVEAGVGVANLCVLGNLSYLLGRPLTWDQAKQEITGDEQARRLMSRPQRYPYCL